MVAVTGGVAQRLGSNQTPIVCGFCHSNPEYPRRAAANVAAFPARCTVRRKEYPQSLTVAIVNPQQRFEAEFRKFGLVFFIHMLAKGLRVELCPSRSSRTCAKICAATANFFAFQQVSCRTETAKQTAKSSCRVWARSFTATQFCAASGIWMPILCASQLTPPRPEARLCGNILRTRSYYLVPSFWDCLRFWPLPAERSPRKLFSRKRPYSEPDPF